MAYSNFKTALYCTANDVEHTDWPSFEKTFAFFESKVMLDKVYLETYRTSTFVSQEKINAAKAFFSKKGISCSGGITLNAKGKTRWDFRSFCYSKDHFIDEMKKVIEFTAKLFDEIILDDFYFTNCKCDTCISEKGTKSWDEYRTEKLAGMSKLMIDCARKANPQVKVIIKYPNWYDDYQYTGYNPKDQKDIHDMIYTGTETRDPARTQQNLPRYLSYFLMRYLENAMPGKNGGGWFDIFDCSYNLNSYLEQAYLTVFAKAKEATLFCMGALFNDFTRFVPLAGYAFERTDSFIGKLGNPEGVACYKPFNSAGDNYMLPALGMIGIPLEPTPYYPENANTIILSKSACCDPLIVDKIKKSLCSGKTIVVTTGFLEEMQDRGFKDIIDIDVDGSVLVSRIATDMLACAYKHYHELKTEMLIPKMILRTNDSWPVIVGQGGENGYPLLIESFYSKGKLIVLNIPERYSDMYLYPEEALDAIRQRLMSGMNINVRSEAGIALFCYDNDHFIIESFLPHNTQVTVIIQDTKGSITNIENERVIEGKFEDNNSSFTFDVSPSNFMVFRVNKSS